jgi:hypothetical protein
MFNIINEIKQRHRKKILQRINSAKQSSKNPSDIGIRVDEVANRGNTYFVLADKWIQGSHISVFISITFPTREDSNVLYYHYKVYNSLVGKTKLYRKINTLEISDVEFMMYTKADISKRAILKYHIVDDVFWQEIYKINKITNKELKYYKRIF